MTPSIDRRSMSHNSPFNYELVFEFIMNRKLRPQHCTAQPPSDPLPVSSRQLLLGGLLQAHEHFCTWMEQERIKCTPKAGTIYISCICSCCCCCCCTQCPQAPQPRPSLLSAFLPRHARPGQATRPIPISLAGLSTRFLRCCHNTHTKRQIRWRNKKRGLSGW